MPEKLSVAIIGCGSFARFFVSLFCAHPLVGRVVVCDLISERAEDFSRRFGTEIIGSFEEALEDPTIDCIANFTRRHQHGDIVIRALKAGKKVYSAVPMASTVEECREIVRLVGETGQTYMIGETCYYYPCAMFCREAYRAGKFGKFAYGSSQYYHHIDSISYGKLKEERGMPPMFYPTHSTAMILSAVDSYVTRVIGTGTRSDDPAFAPDGNPWGNEYINQYAFMELANGGTARVTEARGFGYGRPSSYISSLYGTDGSYEFSNAQHLLMERDPASEKEHILVSDVSDYVNPADMVENKDAPDFREQVANGKWQWNSPAAVQAKETARLPKEYKGLPNGHMATHQLLIDDFCKAAAENKQPVLNAWFAARCNIPGLIAIESAKRGGIPMDVPDLGPGPDVE